MSEHDQHVAGIYATDPDDVAAASEAEVFNSPYHDLQRAWAGPPEPLDRQIARSGDPMPEALEGVELYRALLGAAEAAMLDWRPEVRRVGVDLILWMRDGQGVTLDKWLGLSEAGRLGFRDTARRAERDAALRFIARLPSYADMSTTNVARLLQLRWARWAAAPHERDAEGQTFARLARAGHEPLHHETIRKILARQP